MSTHSLPNSDEVTRDFGTAEIGGHDLTTELLKNGWVKLKDIKRDPTDEDVRRRELENEAKSLGKGLWNPHGPQVRLRYNNSFSKFTLTGTRRASHNAHRLAGFCI